MEIQNTPNNPNNFEEGKQNWRLNVTLFEDLLPSYRNQNSVVLAKKQISGTKQSPEIDPWL